MARSRRTLDRRSLREQTDAAERKKPEAEVEETEEEEDDDEDEEEDEDSESAESEESDEEGDDEDDEEEKPKPKKKKAPPKPRAPRPSRARTPKIVRMRVVWGVFNNSHSMVQEFDYPHRKQAEELAAKLTADKKSGHPFFLQPVKKPIEKEKEKDAKEK
jgi:hypothetical protein